MNEGKVKLILSKPCGTVLKVLEERVGEGNVQKYGRGRRWWMFVFGGEGWEKVDWVPKVQVGC